MNEDLARRMIVEESAAAILIGLAFTPFGFKPSSANRGFILIHGDTIARF